MRIEAIHKMGFYPTPDNAERDIINLLQPADGATNLSILDPCAGEGKAIATLGQALRRGGRRVRTCGVETSDVRAELAAKLLNEVICADFWTVNGSQDAFSVLWLNPPYDFELGQGVAKRDRQEYTFLEKSFPFLAVNGVLVYIIPANQMTREILIYLASRCDDWDLWRLDEGEFEVYSQVVFIGTKSRKPLQWEVYQAKMNDRATTCYRQPSDLPTISQATKTFAVPNSRVMSPRIVKYTLEKDEIIAAYAKRGAHTTAEYQDATKIRVRGAFTPTVPLKTGHLGGLIASGEIGTVQLDNQIVKGRVTYRTVFLNEEGQECPAEESVVESEVIMPSIVTIDRQGNHDIITEQTRLAEFLGTHALELAGFVRDRLQPRYEAPTVAEWAEVSKYALAKKFAGHKGGLTITQKHAAIASARTMQELGYVFLIGEQGSGKTVMSPAVVGAADAFPAIVICPSHLVEKWAREVRDVIPGATSVIVSEIAQIDRAVAGYQDGDRLFVIMSKEQAKLGPGWTHAINKRRNKLTQYCPSCGEAIEYISSDSKRKRFCDNQQTTTDADGEKIVHTCGSPLYQFENAHGDRLANRLNKAQDGVNIVYVPDHLVYKAAKTLRQRQPHAEVQIINTRDGIIEDMAPDKQRKFVVIAKQTVVNWSSRQRAYMLVGKDEHVQVKDRELWIKTGANRWPLADYIRRQYPGFFQTLIADECHKFNGKSTDQARAYHHLIDATKYTINLTGTMMGGKATDIFWILFRNSRKVRQEFDFNDEHRWSSMFGRMERVFALGDGETGSSGRTRRHVSTRELPGISPAIYKMILESCIFVRVSDLGFHMPKYTERVTYLDVAPAVREQLDDLTEFLFKEMEKRSGREASREERRERQSLLGIWVQRMLGRPNSAFRIENVMWSPNGEPQTLLRDGQPLLLEPLIEINDRLPKEAKLVQRAKEEVDQGRKCLVFLRQTATLDIQPRLQSILAQAGLRAVILPETLAANKREAWLNKHAVDIDVLIVNPKKVETGLDLLQFPHIFVYEPDYSLYTMWQAERRAWRPGQEQECVVEYLVYSGTMEDRAFDLMREKKGAVYTTYGDDAGGALVTMDANNILVEMTNRALRGEAIKRHNDEAQEMAMDVENVWRDIFVPLLPEPVIMRPATVVPEVVVPVVVEEVPEVVVVEEVPAPLPQAPTVVLVPHEPTKLNIPTPKPIFVMPTKKAKNGAEQLSLFGG